MTDKRPTNPELCARFRTLLTEDARASMDAATLEATKMWRGLLWKAFAELEERLDPLGVETRRREKLHAQLAGKPYEP